MFSNYHCLSWFVPQVLQAAPLNSKNGIHTSFPYLPDPSPSLACDNHQGGTDPAQGHKAPGEGLLRNANHRVASRGFGGSKGRLFAAGVTSW